MEDMQHQVMGYDRTATMFAPDGHILQVEYAEKTVRLGSASIGIVCKDGVVIVSDRRTRDKLVIGESANKIYEVDEHIMATASGIISDARVLIEKARVISQQHRVTYDSEPNTESIVKEIADIKQQFTQYGGGRPFGVALMVAGFNSKPELFTTDVTGNYLEYHANAIGENDEKLKEKLREKYNENLTLNEGMKLALSIFKETLKEDFNISRFDICIIDKNKKMKRFIERDLEAYK
ncbi:MAG: archaeal proteasome endopeptidase complex subunit alpha [Nanoarchaeota archaeon]|nr:archaeal proteasome endopeptidase complex subunit alpha [Nanoarchaeota archaeon]